MKSTREDLNKAILCFADLCKKTSNYEYQILAKTTAPKLVNMIIYDIFCADIKIENYGKYVKRSHQILLDFCAEYNQTGYITFIEVEPLEKGFEKIFDIQAIISLIESGTKPKLLKAQNICLELNLDFDTLLKEVWYELFEFIVNHKAIYRDFIFDIDGIVELKDINELELCGKNITTLPENIGLLTNLEFLDLQRNQISNIPDSFVKLSNLIELNLWKNSLTSIPKCICKLPNLSELYLSGNKITTLPEDIENLKTLQRLDLAKSQLTYLPQSLFKLKNLTHLWLSENGLSSIPNDIEQLSKLRRLYLNGLTESELEKIDVLLPNCEIITSSI